MVEIAPSSSLSDTPSSSELVLLLAMLILSSLSLLISAFSISVKNLRQLDQMRFQVYDYCMNTPHPEVIKESFESIECRHTLP